MKLKRLLKNSSIKVVKGSKEVEITGICANSKVVSPGNLYIAKKGLTEDGNRYIPEAISAGAAAVLTDIYNPAHKETVQLIYPDRTSPAFLEIEANLAATYYQNPSASLFTVGITGTNGKTTTAFLLKHFLDELGIPSGLMGTIEYIIGKHRYKASHTTPDVTTNHKLLKEMVLQGCKAAVMEVSSHALDQGRVLFIDYDVAIYTNLTGDHLDYHHTLENYCQSKNLLFSNLGKSSFKKGRKTAVINTDCPWSPKMIKGCNAQIITYGIENPADVMAANINLTAKGTTFQLKYQGKSYDCLTPLVGRFNVYNLLAAVATMISKKTPVEKLLPLLTTFKQVPGRLEMVPNARDLNIFVDFAHTEDALENVLKTVSEFKKGKVITVFGCGGDRDRTKRPRMAKVAEKYSDSVIVTSDNPRSEDPEMICREIIAGFEKPDSYTVEVDRKEAIGKAIKMAKKEDIVLIAGKGHEKFQLFAHRTVEFDDCQVAAEICTT